MTQTNLPLFGRNEIEVVVALSVVFWFEFKKKKKNNNKMKSSRFCCHATPKLYDEKQTNFTYYFLSVVFFYLKQIKSV